MRAAGLSSRVCFLGRQERFEAHLRAADVFLLPSESESFGLAALEAMASGVPVVASNVGGIPEVIEDGVTGWLAPVGDVAAHAARVLDIVSSPERHAAFAAAARRRVQERFQAAPALDAYERIYEAVRPTSTRRAPSSPGP